MTTQSKTGAILLAGGIGTRMQTATPKQYIQLKEKPIALYSFELFMAMPEISEIVVVCDPQRRSLFSADGSKNVAFASPGPRRQDSVYNGLQALGRDIGIVCVHDSVRPMIDAAMVRRVLQAAETHGAATAGMPIKFTVKQTNEQGFVLHTPDRSAIWEIQTPQAIKRSLIAKGFETALEQGLTVTDDVSLAELLGHPVKIVEGSNSNVKITTPEDLVLVDRLLER